jgi:hypothetical protein
MKTRHYWEKNIQNRLIEYYWQNKGNWNSMKIESDPKSRAISFGSFEEFIFEHYYGFTKVSEKQSESYEVVHPRWSVFEVRNFKINCDFEAMYGPQFAFLSAETPSSVMLARGSDVCVNWERKKIEVA